MTPDLVDSSYFIALLERRDQWHRRAVELRPRLSRRLVTTDLMAAEVLASLGSRLGGKAAIAAWQVIEDTSEVEFITEGAWRQALEILLSRDGRVSMADACGIQVMIDRGIKRIFSFDDGFDSFESIERVH